MLSRYRDWKSVLVGTRDSKQIIAAFKISSLKSQSWSFPFCWYLDLFSLMKQYKLHIECTYFDIWSTVNFLNIDQDLLRRWQLNGARWSSATQHISVGILLHHLYCYRKTLDAPTPFLLVQKNNPYLKVWSNTIAIDTRMLLHLKMIVLCFFELEFWMDGPLHSK